MQTFFQVLREDAALIRNRKIIIIIERAISICFSMVM